MPKPCKLVSIAQNGYLRRTRKTKAAGPRPHWPRHHGAEAFVLREMGFVGKVSLHGRGGLDTSLAEGDWRARVPSQQGFDRPLDRPVLPKKQVPHSIAPARDTPSRNTAHGLGLCLDSSCGPDLTSRRSDSSA